MTELLWPVLLLLIGLCILVLEAFVPSGGVLGALSAIAIIGSVGLAYKSTGFAVGTVFLVFTSVVVPVAIGLLVRWWPSTPLGKRILIQPPSADEFLPDLSPLKSLVGRYGTTRSKMLPSGAIVVNGKTYDAVSEGIGIDEGTSIRITAVRGRNLVVRPAVPSAEELRADDVPPSEVLDRPIDEVVQDPFEDPLA